MQEQVHTLKEAADWFCSHSTGSVLCVKGDQKKVCWSYPEAKRFFQAPETPVSTPTEQEEDDDSSSLLQMTAGAASAEEVMSDPDPAPDPEPESSFDSGGGDFGGGGGGSDW